VIDHTSSDSISTEHTIFDLFTPLHKVSCCHQAILGSPWKLNGSGKCRAACGISTFLRFSRNNHLPFHSSRIRGRRSRVTDRTCERRGYKRRNDVCRGATLLAFRTVVASGMIASESRETDQPAFTRLASARWRQADLSARHRSRLCSISRDRPIDRSFSNTYL